MKNRLNSIMPAVPVLFLALFGLSLRQSYGLFHLPWLIVLTFAVILAGGYAVWLAVSLMSCFYSANKPTLTITT